MGLRDLLGLAKKRVLLVLVVLRILLSFFNVFVSILMQLGINHVMGERGPWSLPAISFFMVGGSFLFILSYYAYNFLVLEWITEINLHLGERIMDQLLVSKGQELSALSEGKVLNFMSEDMEAISNFLKYGLLPLVDMILTLLAGLAYVFYGHYLIGALFLGAGLVVLFINRHNSKNLAEDSANYREQMDQYLGGLEKIYHTFPIIRSRRRSRWIQERFSDYFDQKKEAYEAYLSTYGKMLASSEGSIGLLEILVLVLGLVLVARGQILLGTMIGVWNAGLGSVLYPLGTLPDYFSYYHQYKVSALRMKDYYEVLGQEQGLAPSQGHRTSSEKKIQVEAISFAYAGKEIFRDFSTSLSGQGMTYITGPSGSGKSTLFQLILQELTPDSGQIVFEGPQDQAKLALVPQKNKFFTTSILENLRLLRKEISLEEVRTMCQRLNILEVLDRLPQQLATIYEGKLLSNGQERRLSLARALLSQADYVFLDEPFADLDLDNQQIIMDVLLEESKKRGIVIISHTRDFMAHADQHIKVGEAYERS